MKRMLMTKQTMVSCLLPCQRTAECACEWTSEFPQEKLPFHEEQSVSFCCVTILQHSWLSCVAGWCHAWSHGWVKRAIEQLWFKASGLKPQTQSGTVRHQNWGVLWCVVLHAEWLLVCSHLWVLLVLEVLVDRGIEVLGIALIQAVNLSLLLDLHVPLSQDELADGLKTWK